MESTVTKRCPRRRPARRGPPAKPLPGPAAVPSGRRGAPGTDRVLSLSGVRSRSAGGHARMGRGPARGGPVT
eukprot:673575-Hanusia_phi.AAC.1